MVTGGVLILNINSTNAEGLTCFDGYLGLLHRSTQALLAKDELLDYTIPFFSRSFAECITEESWNPHSFALIAARTTANIRTWTEATLVLAI